MPFGRVVPVVKELDEGNPSLLALKVIYDHIHEF
jgi:hypothetical protein